MLDYLAADDSSSADSSSSEDELDHVLCELVFAPGIATGPRLNLLDVSNLECEQLFRFAQYKYIYSYNYNCNFYYT